MKLDKETMIKQRFWFLLPFIALFLLIAWICVLGVRSTAAENYAKADATNKRLEGISREAQLKNQPWIDAMIKEVELSNAKKEDLWYKEFNRQNEIVRDSKDPLKGEIRERKNPFITWPQRTREQWMRTSLGKELGPTIDYGEYLGTVPKDEYVEEYAQQFEPVLAIIRDWLDERNPAKIEGAIRVAGGSLNHRDNARNNLLRPWRLSKDRAILSDEAWLLQEDLALKREVFKSLADLLDSYSKLKPEWDTADFTEVKAEAAPPAPPAPPKAAEGGAATPTPPATPETPPPGETPAQPKTSDEPPVFQKYRFYNYVWPNLLDAEAAEKDPVLSKTTTITKLPSTEMYKGWRLDLFVGQDERDEKKLVLRGVSANHSDVFTLPGDIQLAVWYNDTSDNPVAAPLIIADAGPVGPCQYWPGTTALKKLSEKKLKEIPLPANFGKVVRVTRALPAGAVDQQIAFNNEWLVSARLVRKENSPTMLLTGDIINRSGRRLPVAAFTAALKQPNDSRPMLEDFSIPTDAFNAGQRFLFRAEISNPVLPNKIDFIQQRLDWRTTPIKRIERLEFGSTAIANSDRLKIFPLVPYDFKRKDPLGQNVAAAAASTTTTTTPDPNTGGDLAVAAGAGRGGGAGSGGSSGGEAATPINGIPTNRYLQTTPQLRRIPVALVMTVDSTAITDIIAAMSNSRLRFQVTMAPWVKVPNLGRPGATATASTGRTGGGGGGAAAGGGSGTGKSALPTGSGGGGGGAMTTPPPPGTGGVPGAGQPPAGGTGGTNPPRFGNDNRPPGAGAAAGGTGGQPRSTGRDLPAVGGLGAEDDSSVVELQIYGVVTIYESPDNLKRISATTKPAEAPK